MPKVIKRAPHKDILTALSLRADIKSLRTHAFPRGELLRKFCSRILLKKYTMEEYPACLPSLLLSPRYEQNLFTFYYKKLENVCSRYQATLLYFLLYFYYTFFFFNMYTVYG